MDKIIFATGNEGKMKEVRMILEDLGLPVLSLKDAGITADVEENGTTFEENAQIKAKAIMEMTGALVLADDSGLEVDALDKEPGIYSARYMGHDTSYHIKNQNIIDRLEGKVGEERSARFVCAIAAALPEAPWKARSVMKKKGKMDLVMIQSFICRNISVTQQNCLWRKRTS